MSIDDFYRSHLRQLQRELERIGGQLTQFRFPPFPTPEGWRPAINAYRCGDRFLICVELAGMDRRDIEVQVEPRRLLIRGNRSMPEPADREQTTVQVLAMEMDHGPFERELVLPEEVDPGGVSAEHSNGLLWIYLPLRGEKP